MAHPEACAEAAGEVVRSRESAGYQCVGEFDTHEDRDQSAGKRDVDVWGWRGEFYSVKLADDGEGYYTVLRSCQFLADDEYT